MPLDFSKSKIDENGDMIVEGIASDDSEDSDKEFLDPVGFDFAPLLETGVINWNHQAKKDPDAIIGEPIEARITKNHEFYIKGKLYKDDPKAQATYKKAQIMEKNSSTRRLGWSIEGIPLQKDPLNNKRIRKALITGVAITHCPKNANTYVSIVKGMYSEPFVDDDEEKKAMDTEAMAPVTEESVEGKKKILQKSQVYLEILRNFNVDLEKAHKVYEFTKTVSKQYFPEMTTNNHAQITPEVIEKSFAILRDAGNILEKAKQDEIDKGKDVDMEKANEEELKKAKEKEDLEKAKKEGGFKADKTADELEAEVKRKGDLKKGAENYFAEHKEKGRDAYCEDMIRKGMSLSECQGAWEAAITSANSAPNGGETSGAVLKDVTTSLTEHAGVGSNNLEKAKDIQPLVADVLQKGFDFEAAFGRVEHLVKSQADFFGGKFAAMADIIEGQNQTIGGLEKSLTTTLEANNTLVTKLNSLPVSRKSITSISQVQERFEKSNDGDTADKDAFDISKGSGRKALMVAVENHPSYNGDRELQKAVSQLEITKSLDGIALNKLSDSGFKIRMPRKQNIED